MEEDTTKGVFDSYYGEVGITSIDEIHGSDDKMLVLADGTNRRVPACEIDLVVTNEPSTMSDVVGKRVEVMAQDIIDILLKHDLEVIYMETLWNKVGMSIENMRKVANDKLYGKDTRYELTIGDIDRVFKG